MLDRLLDLPDNELWDLIAGRRAGGPRDGRDVGAASADGSCGTCDRADSDPHRP